MDNIYCPGCACQLCDSTASCPVCGAPRAASLVPVPLHNPFKLIALCVVYALAFWFGAMFLLDFASGARVQRLVQAWRGLLLLAAISLSIVLTVRGKLPGTAHIKPSGP